MPIHRSFVAALLALVFALSAHAQSFEQFHPGIASRDAGFDRFEKGYPADAARFFLKGARYGDKTCQIAMALVTWNGEGIDADRARGYVWADLASERGYPDFVAIRERMWGEMSEADRARALEIGPGLYAEYGDDVAKPRAERLLRQGKTRRVGSRTGSAVGGGGTIQMDSSARAAFLSAWQSTPGLQESAAQPMTKDQKWAAMMRVLGAAVGAVKGNIASSYYGPENWEPKYFWRAQDALWVPDGRVTAGELKKAESRVRK